MNVQSAHNPPAQQADLIALTTRIQKLLEGHPKGRTFDLSTGSKLDLSGNSSLLIVGEHIVLGAYQAKPSKFFAIATSGPALRLDQALDYSDGNLNGREYQSATSAIVTCNALLDQIPTEFSRNVLETSTIGQAA